MDKDDFGDDGGGGVAVAAAVAEVGGGGAGVGDGAAHDVQQRRNHTLQELQMLITEINFSKKFGLAFSSLINGIICFKEK